MLFKGTLQEEDRLCLIMSASILMFSACSREGLSIIWFSNTKAPWNR